MMELSLTNVKFLNKKMGNYKVSICVPIYNVEHYIENCARSLFEQSYKDIEFIFVNDCTQDRSIEVLQNVIKDYPQRESQIHIICHKENGGLAKARNTGLKSSSGLFIIHVDSDDYVDKNMVSLLVDKQKENDYDIVSSDLLDHYKTYTEKDNQPIYSSNVDMTIKLLDKSARGCVVARLIRKSLYTDNNISAEVGLNLGEDSLVIPQLAYFSRSVSNVSLPLYHYNRTNESSYTTFFSEKTSEEVWIVYERLLSIFKNKGDVYVVAIQKAKAKLLVSSIICCIRQKGSKAYCRLLLERLHKYKSEYKFISLPYRLVCHIGNIEVLKYYINFAYYVRHSLLFVKSKIPF